MGIMLPLWGARHSGAGRIEAYLRRWRMAFREVHFDPPPTSGRDSDTSDDTETSSLSLWYITKVPELLPSSKTVLTLMSA